MALVDVLIPAFRRKTGLAIVLTSLLGQRFTDFDVIVSDQTPEDERYLDSEEIRALTAALQYHGHAVRLLRNLPARGIAQQRQFLLEHASARYVHYLDDDLILEPGVMQRMVDTIEREGCGFVGCPAAGLAWLSDVRPHQQNLEPWAGPVIPEPFASGEIPWQRHLVNNAANPLHLEQRIPAGESLPYHVAWVGGNLLYDREKLLAVGGFSFWDRLPKDHAGEEVVVQFLLLHEFGGCGLLPTGTYHIGLPTTIPVRDTNATALYEDLLTAITHPRSPLGQ
jgi:glycosyltransferase involved in cell wall biosynthesis